MNKKIAKKIADHSLEKFRSLNYQQLQKEIGCEKITEHEFEGVPYIATVSITYVNETTKDIEVECFVVEKKGRLVFPPNVTDSFCVEFGT